MSLKFQGQEGHACATFGGEIIGCRSEIFQQLAQSGGWLVSKYHTTWINPLTTGDNHGYKDPLSNIRQAISM